VTRRRAVGIALLLAFGAARADAHRLDEYLQATTIAVARDGVRLQLRLTPGVAVCSRVLADIDANGDGVLSAREQRTYAERVLRDLSLAVDGDRHPLRLVATSFPDVATMREGRGEIVLDVEAAVPDAGGDRRLTFENRHERAIGIYLVNALVPQDTAVRITGQRRTVDQSSYVLDYTQRGTRGGPVALTSATGAWPWIGMALLVPLGWIVLLRQRRTQDAGAEARA
jgi:hypothetical protein